MQKCKCQKPTDLWGCVKAKRMKHGKRASGCPVRSADASEVIERADQVRKKRKPETEETEAERRAKSTKRMCKE